MDAGYLAGARAVTPLAVAIAALGVLFGYLATSTGLTPTAAVLVSATVFAGSAQFSAVSILGAGGTVTAAVGAAALLNARYAVMGASVAPVLRGSVWKRLLLAQLVVDETWAIAHVRGGRLSRERLVGAGVVLYAAHVVSTAAGAVAGDVMGDPAAWGLDAAFPALFVILLWPHVQHGEGAAAAGLGAAIALGLTPLTPPGMPVFAAATAALLGLRSR
jgi:4-azaleucine resistance transporter AzlC